MKILFAYDGSDNADAAIASAGKLLARENAEVVVLAVWEPLTVQALRAVRFGPVAVPLDTATEDEHSEHHAQLLAQKGAEAAERAGFRARAMCVADTQDIAGAIVANADLLDADLILLGARGLTGVRAFLGSVSNHVLQHAHRPVLIVPPHPAPPADDAA